MKNQKLFIKQFVIAIITFTSMSFVLKKIFYNDPKVDTYLSFNKGVKEMALSSEKLIDSLIILNDLTFDPTSGKQLDKVLNNLKYTSKEKLVLIGSSQLRTVKNNTSAYNKMVSRKLNQYLNDIQAYNLSLRGMTVPEKLIVAKKTSEILNPNRFLISVTPWDCIANKIRPEVKAIENKKFTYTKRYTETNKKTKKVIKEKEAFPISLNNEITNVLDKKVGEKISIYKNRAAIQGWLKDKIEYSSKEKNTGSNDEFKNNLPDYWRTINQELNNTTGWDTQFAKSGKKAIKILKTDVKKNAKWTGDDITLKQPTTTFEFEGWSKAENVSNDVKLYAIDYQLIFEDGTDKWYYKGLKFAKGTHDWQQVKTRVKFDKKVISIKPHLLFYGGTGTVWFDDIKVFPVYNDIPSKNILPNPSVENALKERVNVSYSYTKKQWSEIKDKMFKVVDFLSNGKTKEKNILLITPFWHNGDKSAYPQKQQYHVLLDKVNEHCKKNDVVFIDASYILNKDNFGVYSKNGLKKRAGKIDVLHFNANGHAKLANYIIKELKL